MIQGKKLGPVEAILLCRQTGVAGTVVYPCTIQPLPRAISRNSTTSASRSAPGKRFLERRQDAGKDALAVATAQDRAGASAEPDHTFGIEKDMGALRLLPLEPEARRNCDWPIMRQLPAHSSSSRAEHGVISFTASVLTAEERACSMRAPTMPSSPMLSGGDPAINDGVTAGQGDSLFATSSLNRAVVVPTRITSAPMGRLIQTLQRTRNGLGRPVFRPAGSGTVRR